MSRNVDMDERAIPQRDDSADYQEHEDPQQTLLIEEMKREQARRDETRLPSNPPRSESETDKQE